ncbi:hypothetical protein PROFUN_13545 [Planoprotostelium fungivorum]|uniref:Uncharacterized protein n=1 Tax=Planoprotostelium fungivorum TaxID=1890364 RepID=A0A2P6N3S5_9EUKA|nr:hypothetical protein PROFUN_13545 [Planoprotostelium fungivorum]
MSLSIRIVRSAMNTLKGTSTRKGCAINLGSINSGIANSFCVTPHATMSFNRAALSESLGLKDVESSGAFRSHASAAGSFVSVIITFIGGVLTIMLDPGR